MATIINLLKKHGMVGSLSKLYDSIENLNDSYLQSNQSKSVILKPVVPNPAGSSFPLLLCNDPASSKDEEFYRCATNTCKRSSNFSDDRRVSCPNCSKAMSMVMTYIAPPPPVQQGCNEGRYGKGVVTYMVMDDLEVKPMSTISSLTLLNTFKVKDVGLLEERVVSLGKAEAVKLLKASFHSEKVLTDVFIKGKRAAVSR